MLDDPQDNLQPQEGQGAQGADAPAADPIDTVVPFPHGGSEEERNRRILAAAEQLAAGVAGSWTLWYARRAEQLGIEASAFAALIKAQIADRGQRERNALAEGRLDEARARRVRQEGRDRQREQQRIEDAAKAKAKEKGKAFADIIKLPSEEHEAKLVELAQKLDADVETLRAEFGEYSAASPDSSAGPVSELEVEPWAEPVPTTVALEELIARINLHIKAKPHEVLAIALWLMMAWVHEEVTNYSVYLVATGPREDCGKTTLVVKVVGRLAPKAVASSSDPTPSSIFRSADRNKPTQIFDNVDTLFQRKPEVTELFLNGWTRDIKVPRTERVGGERVTVSYDPFCPKACSLIGTNLPRPLLGRCLLIELWPLKPGEEVAEVDPFDLELMDAFKTMRRKLARWAADNAAALKSAKPIFPAGFTNRPRANARLLLAIAELGGEAWAETARATLDRLLREKVEPSWLDLLLRELLTVFEGAESIKSAALVKRLTADPTSEWCEYARGAQPLGEHARGHRVTEREVAFLLRKVHVRPRSLPIGKQRVRGYRRQDFLEKEVFQHFLGCDPLIRSPDTQPKSQKSRRKK
jgi:putative DNA primase/helicase